MWALIQTASSLSGTFHVPKFYANLLSVSNLVSDGIKIQFNLSKCIVKSSSGEAIVIVPCKDNLYEINIVTELWNRRFGHVNMKGIHTLQNMASGMIFGKFSYLTSLLPCKMCIKGKKIGLYFQTKGEVNKKTFGDCAFQSTRPYGCSSKESIFRNSRNYCICKNAIRL